MEITKDESGHILKLAGRLDIREADTLRKALQDFTAGGANFAIDLSGVEACDASALQLLISAGITVESAGGRLELVALAAAVGEASAALGFGASIVNRRQ